MNNYFIGGFVAGEGCFSHYISSKGYESFSFAVETHIRDKDILLDIQKTLGCGTVRVFPYRPKIVRFVVSGVDSLRENIVSFMDKYLLYSFKKEQYLVWRKKLISHKSKHKTNKSRNFLGNNI